jgi:hypothetical protein
VLDYEVNFGQAGSALSVHSSGLLTTEIIVSGLTPGQLYAFQVRSRNVKGFAAYSNEVQILAAQTPD